MILIKLLKVQKSATGLSPDLRHCMHLERLRALSLPTPMEDSYLDYMINRITTLDNF